MTTTDHREMVTMSKAEMEGCRAAIFHYMAMATPRTASPEYLWVHMWFGLNHQKIKPGDPVRVQSPDDDPEFVEAEVLMVASYAAFVLTVYGAEWYVWPLVHRLDRLHTEPDFDTQHWVPVQRAMGYEVNSADAAEYEVFLAERRQHRPQLQLIKER